tara:strand:+ start:382 stop:690 length:309 start_codon:yes stop_codon:yes gene_type:complete
MRTLGTKFPQIHLTTQETEDPALLVKSLLNILASLRNYIASVVDFNAFLYFDQNGTPTTTQVEAGQAAVWKDADAASGNSTHYLVYNDGGTVVTFASVETVP